MPVDLGSPAARALAYWGVIHAAAAQHATTAQVWQGIRAAAAQAGEGTPLPPFAGVSALRGYAGRIVRATEALSAAADAAVLDSPHLAEAPWARPPGEQAAVPTWHALTSFTYTDAEGFVNEATLTVIFTLGLPATVGDLRDQVATDVEQALLTGGKAIGTPTGQLQGITSISLLQV